MENVRDEKGQFIEGHPPLHTGVKHEASKAKLDIFKVYEKLGNAEGLLSWVKSSNTNKKEFYKAILQLLPKEIDVKNDGPSSIIYNIIQQLQRDFNRSGSSSLALADEDGVDDGRTRRTEADKEIPE